MLKFTFLIIITFFEFNSLFSQNLNKASKDSVIFSPQNNETVKAVEDLALAHRIAEYGRKNNSIEALISAIKIVSNTNVQQLLQKKSTFLKDASEGIKRPSIQNLSSIRVDILIQDARELARGNEVYLGIINELEATKTQRGALTGPKYQYERILPRDIDTYIIDFEGLKEAIVYVKGDGTTDLDLFVFDENGNVVEQDRDYSDECSISFIPKWTGKFKIKITNNGALFNDYVIRTN
jgi:hypothetical protein